MNVRQYLTQEQYLAHAFCREHAMTPRFELDEDGQHVWWYHQCDHVGIQDDGTVAGQLPLAAEWWVLVNADPITITPSILCESCGTHGFITAGQWVPA